MRKTRLTIIILIAAMTAVWAQEPVLSNRIKKYFELHDVVDKMASENYFANYSDEAIKTAYNNIFKSDVSIYKKRAYATYAEILLKRKHTAEAIEYFDKAFYAKELLPRVFEKRYRKQFMEQDSILFFNKIKEYKENYSKVFTYQELRIIEQISAMVSADQLARNYDNVHPSSALIMYTDSLTMVNMVKIIQENPNILDPFALDEWSYFLLSRHIFTAYPQFWLTYIEPIWRQKLIEGHYIPLTYARTYDQCIIKARGEKSFYGVWDDNGHAANPDTAAVNKHRTNIGLCPLEEQKPINGFFMTY